MTLRTLERVFGACCAALCAAARAATYPLPPDGEDLVGKPTFVEAQTGDTLATLAYEYGVGFRALLHANPQLDPWNLRAHQHVELPTSLLLPPQPREGIVINVPEMRLFYFPKGQREVSVYPVAVGRVDWKTPLGETYVAKKVRNPNWYPPESIRAEHAAQGDPLPTVIKAGDEENPLGTLALRLGWPEVMIHGTNKPLGGIGMPVTHGCIRLYEPDIEELFNRTPVGTKVTIVDQPYKLGRHDGHWFLEAHAEVAEDPHATLADVTPTLVKLRATAPAGTGTAPFDWNRVAAVLRRADGLPTPLNPPRIAPPPPSPKPPQAVAKSDGGGPSTRGGLLALRTLVVLGLLAGLRRRRRGLRRGDVSA